MSTFETDLLVVGSGIAGLTFALKSSPFGKVTIITKKEKKEANTNYAQGGIAAVISKDDNFEEHINDTLIAGDGLCDEKVLRMMIPNAPRIVDELVSLGVEFVKVNGHFDLGREAAHSKRRIVHARDKTGNAIETNLLNIINDKNIEILENSLVLDLIVIDGKVRGVYVLDLQKDKITAFISKIVFLSSGGVGQLYLNTTNPSIATGDGIAMAYRAGAKIANMEFMQFHPTAFYGKKIDDRALLISEAVRGEGGILKTRNGEPFMKKYSDKGDMARRDICARAIDSELKKSGDKFVLLDITHFDAEKIKSRFPYIYETCLSFGLNITKKPIPVVPSAHYICGGILTDSDSKTSIANLYAAGECAYTGVHGSNRLASNSLLEAAFFAERAAESVKQSMVHSPQSIEKICRPFIAHSPQKKSVDCRPSTIDYLKSQLQNVMSDHVKIVRNTQGLKKAKQMVQNMREEIENIYSQSFPTSAIVELRNLLTCASLVIESSLLRKESRGLFYNEDYPQKDDKNFKKPTMIGIKA